jgi:hypothetical protein
MAALIGRGETFEAIAARFEVSKRHVRQRLRSASSHPKTRSRKPRAKRPRRTIGLLRPASAAPSPRRSPGFALDRAAGESFDRSAAPRSTLPVRSPKTGVLCWTRRLPPRLPRTAAGVSVIPIPEVLRWRPAAVSLENLGCRRREKPLQKSGATSLARGLQRAPLPPIPIRQPDDRFWPGCYKPREPIARLWEERQWQSHTSSRWRSIISTPR